MGEATIRDVPSVYRKREPVGWAQATAVIVPVITVVGAIVTVAVTYWLNQRAGRRERQAKAFAEALTAIEDYAMMPYRIRRRLSTPEARQAISVELDKIQSRIAFQHAWLQIEAAEVAAAYDALIRAARSEAGQQMKDAWSRPPPTSDQQMTLEGAYPRTEIDAARSACIAAMCVALGRRKIEGQTFRDLPR
jgi:hypothetical protein